MQLSELLTICTCAVLIASVLPLSHANKKTERLLDAKRLLIQAKDHLPHSRSRRQTSSRLISRPVDKMIISRTEDQMPALRKKREVQPSTNSQFPSRLLPRTESKLFDRRNKTKATEPRSRINHWKPKTGTREDFDRRVGMNEDDFQWVLEAKYNITVNNARRLGLNTSSISFPTRPNFGDILPTRPQLEKLLKNKNRGKRQISNFQSSAKWTMPIKYKIDSMFTSTEIGIIQKALQVWSTETCVTFQQHGLSDTVTDQHILFTSVADQGCSSYVGQISTSNPQPIYLDTDGCLTLIGLPVHEIGHALGLDHEQSRTDRDDYVTVKYSNIQSDATNNFEKVSSSQFTVYDVPYDYGSIMHYASNDFAKTDGTYTVVPTDITALLTIGQRTELAFYGAKLVNTAYCSSVCTKTLNCYYGGYPDPKNCDQCKCPDGWGGTLCNTVDPKSSSDCSPKAGSINVDTTKSGTLMSPGYNSLGYYYETAKCSWLLNSNAGNCIQFWFTGKFTLFSYDACYHWVEVKYKKIHTTRGQRFCGSNFPEFTVSSPATSEVANVLVIFKAPKSYYTDLPNDNMVGFQLKYAIDTSKSCITTDWTDGNAQQSKNSANQKLTNGLLLSLAFVFTIRNYLSY